MNNDRELLELAARSAGMPPPVDVNGVWSAWVGTPENGHWWDPLADDGDALRLATKLRLDIMFFNGFEEVICSGPNETGENIIEPYGDDIDAAVRRAIVRAAAEIGRSMK
jgi:hypothetical protein